jgi:hypothetical protein
VRAIRTTKLRHHTHVHSTRDARHLRVASQRASHRKRALEVQRWFPHAARAVGVIDIRPHAAAVECRRGSGGGCARVHAITPLDWKHVATRQAELRLRAIATAKVDGVGGRREVSMRPKAQARGM